ncbi:MAG: Glycosyltransferase [uncultured bacterium]|nr:MAG: Glycosyltransferase [uncultured bacterium]KKP27056.1 MAG: Glycosyltransferase [candidate division TM6 bacterium GW2011_GWF2_30_66]
MYEAQYYKDIKNKRIAIFGITPPPIGGVSVHIDRIAKKFTENNNKVYHFKTEFRGRRYLLIPYLFYAASFLFYNKIDIVYYHSSYLPNSFTEILFLSRIKNLFKFIKFNFILVEHNCRHMYKRNKEDLCKINKALENTELVVFLWKTTYDSYFNNNIKFKKYIIDSAFLMPNISNKNEILKTYPQAIYKFINNHRPILLVNASIISTLEKDLYGLDKSINATYNLKKDYKNIGLIIALANIGDQKYFESLKEQIKKLGLQDNIFFLLDQHEMWPLIEKIDIFLRPTLRDGTAISIFEAFIFKKPVVASNVCTRPEGSIIFDINSQTDFVEKIKEALK